MASRAAAARRIGITRAQLVDLERDDIAHAERDERGVPNYTEAEIERLAVLARSGQFERPSQPAGRASRARRRPTTDIATTSTAVHLQPQPADAAFVDDPALKRLHLAVAIAEADMRRIQSEAMRDEALRLQRDAARARRVEQIVEQTVDTVFPFERDVVERTLRQRLLAQADLDDSFEMRALIARAIADTRTQLLHQRAEADRIAAERRSVAERAAQEAQQRVIAARAADEARASAEQQARTNGLMRAQTIASAIASEVAWFGHPPWVIELAGRAAWQAITSLDMTSFNDDVIASSVARTAGQQAVMLAMSTPPPGSEPPAVDDLSVWRRRKRRR